VEVRDVRATVPRGVDPFVTPIIVTALVTVAAAAAIIDWVRRRTQCQIILDVRQAGTFSKTVDCRVRDGRIIVLAQDGTRVEIHDVPELFDFGAIVDAGLGGGGAAVATAALRGGASVDR
jgi:hypothetical protein